MFDDDPPEIEFSADDDAADLRRVVAWMRETINEMIEDSSLEDPEQHEATNTLVNLDSLDETLAVRAQREQLNGLDCAEVANRLRAIEGDAITLIESLDRDQQRVIERLNFPESDPTAVGDEYAHAAKELADRFDQLAASETVADDPDDGDAADDE